jgi:hypothetical protein
MRGEPGLASDRVAHHPLTLTFGQVAKKDAVFQFTLQKVGHEYFEVQSCFLFLLLCAARIYITVLYAQTTSRLPHPLHITSSHVHLSHFMLAV